MLDGLKQLGDVLRENGKTLDMFPTPAEQTPPPLHSLRYGLTAILEMTPAGQAVNVIEQALIDAYGEEFGRAIADCIGGKRQ